MPDAATTARYRRPGVGAGVLGEVESVIREYVVLPSENAYTAVTLWIAASHAVPFSDMAPRLAVVSPTKRCGKSRLMDIVECMAYAPFVSANSSVAALVRSINPEDPPTVLLDEADTVFGNKKAAEGNEDLRGMLNAGHQRGRYVTRWDMKRQQLERLETFSMAMLCSIRDLPDTIMDRAVVIRMRRRVAGEAVSQFRPSRHGVAITKAMNGKITAWVRSYAKEIAEGVPQELLPVEDRAADTWELLVAIADIAGGEWSARARKAAYEMTTNEAETDGGESQISQELLTDIRTVLEGWDETNIHSGQLINKLITLEDSRWHNYAYGRAISYTDLSSLLKPFEVHSKGVKVSGVNRKGFTLASLTDAFRRYLQPTGSPTVAPERRTRVTSNSAPGQGTSEAVTPVTPRSPRARRSRRLVTH